MILYTVDINNNKMGISLEARNEKYLGLLVYMDRSRFRTFGYIKDHIWRRIHD
jgi:hypothetical protein